jgi:hypothetical protein
VSVRMRVASPTFSEERGVVMAAGGGAVPFHNLFWYGGQ